MRTSQKAGLSPDSLQDNFAPLVRGASIRGCVQRGPGGGATGFSPFFFLCAQGTEVTDRAYLLGLSDDDPHRIVLRKGQIATGIPGEGGPGVLLQSSESFRQGTWLHLRLDVIVNDNGDVVLRVLRSDLENHPVEVESSRRASAAFVLTLLAVPPRLPRSVSDTRSFPSRTRCMHSLNPCTAR